MEVCRANANWERRGIIVKAEQQYFEYVMYMHMQALILGLGPFSLNFNTYYLDTRLFVLPYTVR
jgi:hypothetical protein